MNYILLFCFNLGKVKLVKGSKPLVHHKFYLDIENNHLTTRIENKIKELGGVSRVLILNKIEVFVVISVKFFKLFYGSVEHKLNCLLTQAYSLRLFTYCCFYESNVYV